jgi:cytochrome c oxidase assembly protein subunit 15/protoheme IX farnesyltransferase
MRRFAQFAWTVLGFNILVILWGALVRASRSGEGCGDHWPLCNGTVIPHAAQIATLIEFTHRLTTGIAFISVVVMAVWAFRRYRQEPVWPAAAASLALIVTEALLGAGLVLFKFVGTDVSVGRVVYLSAHLINTLLMLAAMALTAWWASGHHAIRLPDRQGRPIGFALLCAVGIAVTGVVTALSDTLYPVTSLRAGFQADFAAASPLLLKLRIWHPLIAIVAGACIVLAISRIDRVPRLRQIVIALVGMELAAGVLNLSLLAPVWMQLIHLLLADLLWIALVLLGAAVLEEYPVPEPQRNRVSANAAIHTLAP